MPKRRSGLPEDDAESAIHYRHFVWPYCLVPQPLPWLCLPVQPTCKVRMGNLDSSTLTQAAGSFPALDLMSIEGLPKLVGLGILSPVDSPSADSQYED